VTGVNEDAGTRDYRSDNEGKKKAHVVMIAEGRRWSMGDVRWAMTDGRTTDGR
jgi:hypothetical protein